LDRKGRWRQELGHYPTAKAAEAVGHKLALKRRVEFVTYGKDGKAQSRTRPRKSWLRRLLGK
jgi:hypothetical protein